MNRKERRAHQAVARKDSLSTATVVHEAGHAVGYLLTCQLLGRAPERAVTSIELGAGRTFDSQDGRASLATLAECMAPMMSDSFQGAVESVLDIKTASMSQLWDAFCVVGTQRDREINMWCRMLSAAMGGAAEAKLRGLAHPMLLFLSYTCEDDLLDIWRACKVLGIADSEQLAVRNRFLDHATYLVNRPSVWLAINAVASRLKRTMPGTRVAQLAWPHLEHDPEVFAVVLPREYMETTFVSA